MNLGKKSPDYGIATSMPDKKSKPTIHYPQVTIEKPFGSYKFGDEFTAQVRFRVRKIEHGKDYSDKASHRCVLEIISMTPTTYSKKGLPHS